MIDNAQKIRNLINKADYFEAVYEYYSGLGDSLFDVTLNSELLYLKLLADCPIIGRDILSFLSPSSITPLIKQNMQGYSECIDNVLTRRATANLPNPIDVLTKYALTIENVLSRLKEEHSRTYVYLSTSPNGGILSSGNKDVTVEFLRIGYRDPDTTKWYKFNQGRLFSYYPDVVQHCSLIEAPIMKKYFKLWTRYSRIS